MKNYNIYYMKPGTFRVLIHGDEQPQLAKQAETHVLLPSVQAERLEEVYIQSQGEV
jgi:hypothetical protein